MDLKFLSLHNSVYRKVVETTKGYQVVLMSLEPGEDIPEEVHEGTQMLMFVKGKGNVVKNGVTVKVRKNDSAVILPGEKHYVKNTSRSKPLKLWTVYLPPEHEEGTLQIRQHQNP